MSKLFGILRTAEAFKPAKKQNKTLWILAAVGVAVLVAGIVLLIAYLVRKGHEKDEEYEDFFEEDDFDEEVFDEAE